MAEAPKSLIGQLDFYLVQRAPFQLPPAAREWIVSYGPWIIVALIVIGVPTVLLALGVGAALLPFSGGVYAGTFGLTALMVVVQIGLRAIALPGLFARKLSGWTMLFYAQIASFVFSVLSGAIVSGAVSLVLSMYVLFQIRSLYRE